MHTQKYQEIYDSVKTKSSQVTATGSTDQKDKVNNWPKEVIGPGNYSFTPSQFSALRAQTDQSREILASLSDLLNKRITDIGKVIFRLQVEENFCLKFKDVMKNYLEKQHREEGLIGRFVQVQDKAQQKKKDEEMTDGWGDGTTEQSIGAQRGSGSESNKKSSVNESRNSKEEAENFESRFALP